MLTSVPLVSCGYHVAGQGDLVPKSIQTIAIPPFANATVQYKLTDRLSEAITREFIARTHYQVIHDAQEADAVLRGSVLNFIAFPILIDPTTGRPREQAGLPRFPRCCPPAARPKPAVGSS